MILALSRPPRCCPARGASTFALTLFLVGQLVGSGGCATQETAEAQREALAGLAANLDAQAGELASVEARLDAIDARQDQVLAALAARAAESEQILAALEGLSGKVDRAVASRPRPIGATTQTEVRTVVLQGDKMVVGSVEKAWIDPPGAIVTARVDSGAESSSLHAADLVEFERDGEDWVRFRFMSDADRSADSEGTEIERQVVRHVRVVQQSNPDGERRPVVEMRVTLGDIQGKFEFTLADREHLDQEALLGRNFLTDVAVVDVGRSFVQKAYSPEDSARP
jgi:hypothetical protein